MSFTCHQITFFMIELRKVLPRLEQGPLHLLVLVTDFQAFSTVIGTGTRTYYYIEAVNSVGVLTGSWEIGWGVYTLSGTSLTRNLITSSTGSLISLSGLNYVSASIPAYIFNNMWPNNYIDGLQLALNGTNTQSLSIIVGVAKDSTNTFNMTLASTFYKTLASTFSAGAGSSGSPNGGLATGTVAALTWYHVFLIAKDSGVTDIYFDTSVTAANIPSGWTYYRRIGSIKTNASSANILPFTQTGGYFAWQNTLVEVNGANIANDTLTTVTLSYVPPGVACSVDIRACVDSTATGASLGIWSPGNAGSFNNPYDLALSANVANIVSSIAVSVYTNTTPQIVVEMSYGSSTTTNNLYFIGTVGWLDFRGKQ